MADQTVSGFVVDCAVPLDLGAVDNLGRFVGPVCDYRDPDGPNGELLAFPVYEGDGMEPAAYEIRYYADPYWWEVQFQGPCPVTEPQWVTAATIQGNDALAFARQFMASFRALMACDSALRKGGIDSDFQKHMMEWALRTAGWLTPEGLGSMGLDPEPWAQCERPDPTGPRIKTATGWLILTDAEPFEWHGLKFFTCLDTVGGYKAVEARTGAAVTAENMFGAARSREDAQKEAIHNLDARGLEKVQALIASLVVKFPHLAEVPS